ncbi:unnamed protein product [marine sediment metagenome]|uniref:Transcription elongation factor GreA/GreB C-terminal domain-containing protein n=1 Tax=marine sediment metagenome TaxID=412755 RepID=X0VD38_9ZZZZ
MKYTTHFQYNRLVKKIQNLEELASEAAKRMGVAADFGDLRENAEFQYAEEERNEKLLIIKRFKGELRELRVVPIEFDITKVDIGKYVKVREISTNDEKIFNIVGDGPIKIDLDEIPYKSPIGDGLCGLKIGDIAKIKIPIGIKNYEILEIGIYSPREG